MFGKKHYMKIAEVLRNAYYSINCDKNTVQWIQDEMGHMFSVDSNKFD